MEHAVIVYNPVSRKAPSLARLEGAARALLPHGWQVDVRSTSGTGDGTAIAREAAQSGASVVVACGGDGTINEVVNGIAYTGTALAVIRAGMGDVFGREVGVPRSLEKALDVLLTGERRRFDLGRVNDRYFLLMAGVGFDAKVVNSVPRLTKKILGSTSYAVWGVGIIARYRSRHVTLRIDGELRDAETYWILLGCTRSYGGVLRIADQAFVDDGLLDLYLFEGSGIGRIVSTASRIFRRRLIDAPGVTFKRVDKVDVITPGLAIQVDGEYIGETPVSFSVAPAAIDILLPQGHGAELFSDSTVLSAKLSALETPVTPRHRP